MRSLPAFLLACLAGLLWFNNTVAQKAGSDWRVATKTLVAANGQRFSTQYDYSKDGRIKNVKNLSVTGVLTTTTSDFQFGRNNKPSSYVVTYNREGGQASVSVQYDNSGRITELVKTVSLRDVTTYTYRYSNASIIITQRKTTGESNITDGKITSYTEHGDYAETVSDAASQLIVTTITLNSRRNPELEPWPDNLMGGYEAPVFFGVQAYSSAPQATATKNSEGLITTLTLSTTSSTRKFEYTYINPGAIQEEAEQTGTKIVITTNINCPEGKQQVERILGTLDGIFSAVVDLRTGKLSLDYTTDGTSYDDVIKAINDAGFDADRKKALRGYANPCSKKPAEKPEQTGIKIIITTNINCLEGKQEVERVLSTLDGIFSAIVDIRTGKLSLDYSPDGTSYRDIITSINSKGFDADKFRSTNSRVNPCIKKLVEEPGNTGTEIIITTTINCTAGKSLIETELKKQDGVKSAVVDIKTGKLVLSYSPDGTSYRDIVSLINSNGFDADRTRTTNPAANPCNVVAQEPTVIATSVNCAAGKKKLESILLAKAGVKSVTVDANSGKVTMDKLSDKMHYKNVIQLINDAGFDADGFLTKTPAENPCQVIPKSVYIIETNIGCKAGKEKVEKLLSGTKGINSVSVDTATGKVTVTYDYALIKMLKIYELINNAGFDANGHYTNNPDADPCATKTKANAITSVINGRFVYRFMDETEQPAYSSFSFPSGMRAKKLPPPANTSVLVPNTDPYPDFICNGFFPKLSSRPLRNARIKLVYAVFTSTVKTPTQYNELKSYDKENAPNTQYGSQVDNDLETSPDYLVDTTTTDANGNFSFSFVNNLKIGLIRDFGEYGKYGALRIAVIEEKYCNSDIILFPKPGKTMVIPEETILLQSYNLEVTVKADGKTIDQVVKPGEPLPGYPVQVAALKQDYPAKSWFPVEANIESYKTLSTTIDKKAALILDIGKTDEKGRYVFKNLLRPEAYTPKLSDTRYFQAVQQQYEGNFVYATTEIAETGLLCNSCPIPWANYKLSRRNSLNKVTTRKREIILQPKSPEIYLRTINLQNGTPQGLENVTVTITEYADNKGASPIVNYYKTDKNGYLHLKDIAVTTQKQGTLTKVIGPYRDIRLSKPGYTDKDVAKNQLIQLGERFPAIPDQLMIAGGVVKGYVVNENNEPVVCNIKVGNGLFIKTESNGRYMIDNCQTGIVSFQVVPLSGDNYFPESMITGVKSGVNYISNVPGNKDGKIVVIQKLHRVRFKIVDENGKPVKASCVGVGLQQSSCYASDPATGLTNVIALPSPEDEFRVRVVAPGYVTYDDYKIIPETKKPVVITITLIKGQLITGIVIDAKTKAPIKNARVYTVSGTNEDGQIQNETYTNANGEYKLDGAVNQGIWLQQLDAYLPLPVTVYAVKGGNPAYLRESQSVQGINGTAKADFALNSLNVIAEIWGLPVELTSAEPLRNKIVKISGSFVQLPSNGSFKTGLPTITLPFKDIEVTMETGPKNDPLQNEKPAKIKPLKSSIDVEATTLKLTAFQQYACEVSGSTDENTGKKLKITNNQECGQLAGFVKSELSSFNFAYKYNGKFMLHSGIPGDMQSVLGAATCFSLPASFKLSALNNKEQFKVHDFDAQIGANSYVDKDGYSINADVRLNIPMVSKKSQAVGQIKVNNTTITWEQYKGEINLPLEKWAVSGTGLQYDLNQGGFRVTDGSLRTDLPQVPLKDLIIRPTSIDLGANSLTGREQLTLSSVVSLHITPGAKLTLNYEDASTFDQQPHYRLNISSPTKTVAALTDLPGLDAKDSIRITLLSTYSDAIHRTVVVNPEPHRMYNVISQTVTGIEALKTSFTLIGNTTLEIPNANDNVTGRFQYYKDPSDPTRDANNVVCKIQKLQTDVEMPGKVKFNGTNFKLTQNNLIVNGEVVMYKNSVADGVKVNGTLTKTMTSDGVSINMDIDHNQKIVMGGAGSKAIQIEDGGGNKVDKNKWTLVKFTGLPVGYNTGKGELLKPGYNLIDFVVDGAISSDKSSGKTIKLDGIETPFGGISISLDFEKKILQGSLLLVNAGIPLGPVTINDGTFDMQIDSKGFILVGAVTDASITGITILDNFKAGIALGFYDGALPDYMTKNLLGVTLYQKLPGLESGLKGFYVNVSKSLGKEYLEDKMGVPDIPGLKGFIPDIDFSAGLDIRFLMNLQKETVIEVGGLAFAEASFTGDLAGCTIGFGAKAAAELGLGYYGGDINGFIQFSLKGTVYFCGDASLGIIVRLEKKGSDFEPSVKFEY